TEQIDAQQLIIAELQVCDEESKQAINKLTLRIDSCEENNQDLQKTLEMVTKIPPLELALQNQTNNLTKEENDQLSKIVKAAFSILYGITRFNPRDHGLYPTVSKEHMAWPHKYDGNRRVEFHRFNFGKDFSYGSPCNNDSFRAWVDLSLEQGAALIGRSELPPHVLNRENVTSHCISHFKYLQRRVRDYFKNDPAPVVGIKCRGEGLDEPVVGGLQEDASTDGVDGLNLGEGGMAVDPPLLQVPSLVNHPGTTQYAGTMGLAPPVPESKDVKPIVGKKDKNSRENMHLRSQGKLTIRIRKRAALNGDNETYKLAKYDGFFTLGGTSDDEVVEVTSECGDIVKEFHARPWAFASDKRIKCQEAIDATPDPHPSVRQTIHKHGATMVNSPSISKSVKTGVLSWMVKPEILAANPKWLTQNKVYPSGPEWGEDEPRDPVPKTKASKRVKLEDMVPNLDQIHKAQEEWQVAQQKVEEYQNAKLTEAGLSSSQTPM
ncbi:hypothetical protein FRC11_002463, partial [Ceratobasidium sp. 423]